jgi:ABC-type transport system involved in cytochrome c biogenesis permease subunit
MQVLVVIGAIVALAGVGGLFWCVRMVWKARREAKNDDDLRLRLQSVVSMNLAALGVSAIGLMLVVAGIILG